MKRLLIISVCVAAIIAVGYLMFGRSSGPSGPVVPFQAANMVSFHNGYWVAELRPRWSPATINAINDLHYNPETNRVTVYAQARILGRVIAPAQVGPGECTESGGETVCFHPDAVYLNGTGEKSMEEDGSGSWWVEHSWVLGGEGYDNCELRPAEVYDECIYVEGKLLEDGLTMKIGGESPHGGAVYNTRVPVLKEGDLSYVITRFGPVNMREELGDLEFTTEIKGSITMECEETPSPFDGIIRGCPTP